MRDERITRREFIRDGAVAAAGVAAAGAAPARGADPDKKKILCYNENMEYRRLGKTEQWVSAVSLGGHWKRVEVMGQDFDANRREVVARCMDVGINYIDACCGAEVMAYTKALGANRSKIYLALSYCEKEVRDPAYRTARKLLENLDELLQQSKQEYTDIWRITCLEPGGQHSFDTSCEMVEALEKAKKQGKARYIGMSSHDRRWHKMMIEYFPQIEVILFPYTAMTKELPKDSLFEAVRARDIGVFGIKPFANNSIFKGDSSPKSPHAEEDDRRARLAIRCILENPSITSPIPGLVSIHQVDNMALAIQERRREIDQAERAELEIMGREMWANLPANYRWLRDWQFV